MNNENNNDSLNSVSLGLAGNINSTPAMPIDNLGIDTLNGPAMPVNNVAPVSPVPPLEMNNQAMGNINNGIIGDNLAMNSNPSFGGINNSLNMGMESSSLNSIPPLSTPMYDSSQSMNNFSSAPIFNDIGTIPPISNIPVPNTPIEPFNNNKKEPKSGKFFDKLIFVIIVILVLTAVGVGVYIFLEISNRPSVPAVRLRNVQLEIGSSVPTKIEDYAAFNGINASSCTLDTSGITNTDTLNAKYTFKITCGEKVYNGNVAIVDTEKPNVSVKEVSTGINGVVKPEDFIENCTDKTKCSYEFKDSEAVKNHVSKAGDYKVVIITKDEAGNVVETEAKLKVTSDLTASLYLVCSKEINGNNVSDRLGIDGDSNFIKVVTRNYVFNLNETNYNAFKTENANKSEAEYNGIKGSFALNDQTKTLTISKKVTYEELKNEMGSDIPIPYSELKSFYRSKGYNCTVGN